MLASLFSSLALFAPLTASASSLLGLSTPPLHFIVAADMTGSSKNPAFNYAKQAKLLSQSILLNQVRSGDTITLLRVCSGVQTIADFTFQSQNGARLAKSDILRYTAALTEFCTGKGSAITASVNKAASSVLEKGKVGAVAVLFTDGAILDDPHRAALSGAFAGLLSQPNTREVFLAGLSPEKDQGGTTIRDTFVRALGSGADDKRVLMAGAYDLSNVYPAFAGAVKQARK